jgi:hypothetical protein
MTNFFVTCAAMLQILVAVVVGAAACRGIPNVSPTLRDFSFVISRLLVPCLIGSHMIVSMSVTLLLDSMVLVVFSVLGICVGTLCARIVNLLLFTPSECEWTEQLTANGITLMTVTERSVDSAERRTCTLTGSGKGRKGPPVLRVMVDSSRCCLSDSEIYCLLHAPPSDWEDAVAYRCMCSIACSIQNTVVIPLSLIAPIASSVAWIDLSAAVTYLFVYNIVVTVFFWGMGTFTVLEAAEESRRLRERREVLQRIERLVANSYDAATQTLSETELQELSQWHHQQQRLFSMGGNRSSFAGSAAAAAVTQSSVVEINHSSSSILANPLLFPHDDGSEGVGAIVAKDPLGSSLSSVGSITGTGGSLEVARNRQNWEQQRQQQQQVGDDGAADGNVGLRGRCEAPALHVHRFRFDCRATRMVEIVRQSHQSRHPHDPDVTVVASSSRRGGTAPPAAVVVWLRRLLRTCASFANPPFVTTIVALLIGLLPFKSAMISLGPVRMVLDCMILVGAACVPASLLLLGANLSGLSGAPTTMDVKLRHSSAQAQQLLLDEEGAGDLFLSSLVAAEQSFLLVDFVSQEPDMATATCVVDPSHRGLADSFRRAQLAPAAPLAKVAVLRSSFFTTAREKLAAWANAAGLSSVWTFAKALLSIKGVVKANLIVAVVVLRSVVIPGVSFILIHLCVRMNVFPSISAPQHNTLLLVLFLEVSAPSAINTALLFSMRQFSTKPFAKLLLYLYLSALWSVVLWLSVAMLYVN